MFSGTRADVTVAKSHALPIADCNSSRTSHHSSVGPDDAAFQAIHVEKIVDHAIEAGWSRRGFRQPSWRASPGFAVWRESHEFLAGRSDRGNRRLEFMRNAIEQRLAQSFGIFCQPRLGGEVFARFELAVRLPIAIAMMK